MHTIVTMRKERKPMIFRRPKHRQKFPSFALGSISAGPYAEASSACFCGPDPFQQDPHDLTRDVWLSNHAIQRHHEDEGEDMTGWAEHPYAF